MDLAGSSKHLLDYWAVLVRRRWVVYLALAMVTLTALIGSFLVTPLYRATTTIQIERQNPDILTFQDLSRVDYSWAAYGDFYETQYKIIASTAVARKAAERLQLTSHPKFIREESELGLLDKLKSLVPRRTRAADLDPLDVAAARVLAGLEVQPVRNSQLVQVAWISDDPELAAQVANAVASAFIQLKIEVQFSTTDQAQEFLIDQIGALKTEIGVIENQLQLYGEAKRIISIDDASNITLQALQDVARERTAAQTTLATAEAAFKSVLDAEPQALPEVRKSELIARLRQEHADHEVEFSEKSRQFREDWPGIQTLRSKLEQSKSRLDLETKHIADQVRAGKETAYRDALREVSNLDALLRQQEDAAQNLKRDAVEFANLKSEVEKKRETLDALMGRQGEMALSSRLKDLDSSSTNVRIMEVARPPAGPFRPNTRVNLGLGLLLGLTLGLGMAFFLDYLDNTINSPRELDGVVSLPVMAVVPRHSAAPSPSRVRRKPQTDSEQPFDFVSQLEDHSGASEAYRELRTSILLSTPGHPPRQIMISSALPGEGKTATAINLAIVLSQLGRRVLLVDTDLRRPRLHRAFGVENARGISTCLSGLEKDPLSLVVHTDIDNLDLMTSGPIPPNPSELLNAPVFQQLGNALISKGYDHVIFDSPPVLSVSDPVIISSVVQTGILVVRAGRTPRQSVRMAEARFQHAGAASFGIVLNGLDASSSDSSYYRYHYDEQHDDRETGRPLRKRRSRSAGA